VGLKRNHIVVEIQFDVARLVTTTERQAADR
jgi:hypothetical protein